MAKSDKTRKRSSRKFLLIAAGVLILVVGLIFYFRYWFQYSDGTRVGILYKFSRKGTLYKTYEGEMILPGFQKGMESNWFYFSVDDEEVAKKLMQCQGMEVEVHYVQFNNPLPWRGKTYENVEGQYVVDGLTKIKDKDPEPYAK